MASHVSPWLPYPPARRLSPRQTVRTGAGRSLQNAHRVLACVPVVGVHEGVGDGQASRCSTSPQGLASNCCRGAEVLRALGVGDMSPAHQKERGRENVNDSPLKFVLGEQCLHYAQTLSLRKCRLIRSFT